MDLKKEIDKHLEEKERKFREREHFYASELGNTKRQIFENFKNAKPQKFSAITHRIFDNGNEVHKRYMRYFIGMGILVAAEIDVGNDLVHGRCDAVITDKKQNYVVEIKSCSQWTFNKLEEPKPWHKIQLMIYMHFLNIPQGILLYENKDNQQIKTFDIKLEKELIEKILVELKKLKEMIDSNIEPENAQLLQI
jgi:CRISPR/Cas system-associated exonuclease Cas4 (RecB family)